MARGRGERERALWTSVEQALDQWLDTQVGEGQDLAVGGTLLAFVAERLVQGYRRAQAREPRPITLEAYIAMQQEQLGQIMRLTASREDVP
jgi:hypothetical protein